MRWVRWQDRDERRAFLAFVAVYTATFCAGWYLGWRDGSRTR